MAISTDSSLKKTIPSTINPDALRPGKFETNNYKVAASDGDCSISTILLKNRTL